MVATSLFAATGNSFAISGYCVVLALAALNAFFARETNKSPLLG